MVLSGLVIACRFAICPTKRSPPSVKPTIDGVVREPSELGITTGSEPSITATQELVVPRSMPITLLMVRRSPGRLAGVYVVEVFGSAGSEGGASATPLAAAG